MPCSWSALGSKSFWPLATDPTTSNSMFFRTNPKLLRPVHSLLKEPFGFSAYDSISGPLHKHLSHRADYDDLVALGQLYDQARLVAQGVLVRVRPLLENSLSVVIYPGTDLTRVCRTKFDGEMPKLPGMTGAEYLSHVSAQCQLERLYDLLGLQCTGRSSALQNAEIATVVQLLMLNEALALCLAGIAKVVRHANRFDISVADNAGREMLRATWFARTLDQSSRGRTIAMIKDLSDAGKTTAKDLEPLIERILEQDLAIPWHRLTDQGRALQSIQHLYDAVALVAVVAVADFRCASIKMTRPDLMRHGLEFGAVSAVLRRQSHALVTDQFITRKDDTLNVRIEGSSKGLRSYYRTLEKEFGECDVLREQIGGFFFEKTHIRQRIEHGEDYKSRYQILEGFDRYKVLDDAPNESDVEFIIKDIEQRHYYFVQIKHSLLGERAFFNSIIEATQNDIGKGILQLREAKRLLEAGLLHKTLAARGIDDAAPDNSSFVLLHNIAQLDFQSTDDGISLYDWATFRNLLKDAECLFGTSNGEQKYLKLQSPLVIAHPMAVIQRLLGEHPAYRAMNPAVWSTERATTEYAIEGKTIRVIGLGI